jgi:type I restriction enzyme S subunit
MLDIEVFEGGFKETELGPLPEEWEVVRLGEVGNYINGYAFKPSDWSKVGKPIIRIQNLNNPLASFNYYNGELDHKYLVKKGDILISWSASLGVYLWKGEDAWLNQHIFKVELTNQKVLKDYFYFALLYYFTSQAFTNLHGSTMKHIVKSKFLNISIPLPPLEEQKAIAGILSTVQSAIEKTEKVINALKNFKKSMMKHLFTYGPVAEEEAEKVELKETEIGLIPKHWEVVRLGEVFDVKQGKQLSSKESKEGKTLRPFLRTSNVLWNKIDISSISYMPFSDEEFETLKLRRGDILVCEGGDVGRTSVWEGQLEECAYQNHLHRLRPKENNIVNYFFSYWMEYAICLRGFYVNSANRTTIPNLSAQRLKSFLIPLPSLEEQQKIAQILQSIDQRIEKEEKYKNALQNLFKSLLHNLMTGKIRVRVKDYGED